MKHYNADNNDELRDQCPWFFEDGRPRVYDCSQNNRPLYRPVDGTCNLLSTPHLGQSFTPFQRLLPAEYGPDILDGRRNRGLRKAKSGDDLPNARKLSNLLAKTTKVWQIKGYSFSMMK